LGSPIADQSAGSSWYASSPLAASYPQFSAAAGVVPGYPVSATAGTVPLFAAAAAVPPVTPVILPGVYCSQANADVFGLGNENDHASPVLSSGRASNMKGTGVFLGGRYTMEEVINFGGISQADSLVRSSERIRKQANADDSQLDRAMKLAEAKNTGSSSGNLNNSKFFISSIPHERIIANVSRLGVSLGESDSDVSKTLDLIQNNDSKRTLVMLSKNLEEKTPDQAEVDQTILTKANNLSADLDDEYLVESDDGLNLTLAEIKKNTVLKKKKVSIRKTVVRRSDRLKKNKKSK
jgi:hypothetical protein